MMPPPPPPATDSSNRLNKLMAKPRDKGTRTYLCHGRLNRGTNAHELLKHRRVTAGVIHDSVLGRLTEEYPSEAVDGNTAQKLATVVCRELGLSSGPLNSRCRIAIAGNAANGHNNAVDQGAGQPRRYNGQPVRTIQTYANGQRLLRPLVTVNGGGKATLRIQGLPPIRLITARALPSDQPTYAAVSVDGRRVQVALTYRVDQEPLPDEGEWSPRNVLGLDLGITDLVSSSAGISFEGINQRELQERIRRAQQAKQAEVRRAVRRGEAGFRASLDENNRQIISEKGTPRRYLHWLKGRPNRRYRKARRGLSALLRQRARQRRDYRHRVAAEIVRHCVQHGISLIALEDLRVRNMTASSRGTVSSPNPRSAAKRGLNRRVLEQGWAELCRFTRYKARAKGIRTVLVNAGGTSQTCSQCGRRDRKSRKGSTFSCTGCPYRGNANYNASVNIGDRGTLAFEKHEGATLESVRRRRLAAAEGRNPRRPALGTGTDELAGTTRRAPTAALVHTLAQVEDSSQPALCWGQGNARSNFAIV